MTIEESKIERVEFLVRVTIEKEIKVYLPKSFTEEKYLNEFKRFLWDIDGVDDVAKYAARMVAYFCTGMEHDGIGLLQTKGGNYPRPAGPYDVEIEEISDDCEAEIITKLEGNKS